MNEDKPGMRKTDVDPEVERIAHDIIGAAIEVHRELGPGLLEGIYEDALEVELELRGIKAERQVQVPVMYKGRQIRPQRVDLFVERCIIVENKSTKAVAEGELQQCRSYLRAAGLPLGLVFNFREVLLRDGLYRVFNKRATGYRRSSGIETSSSSCAPSSPSR